MPSSDPAPTQGEPPTETAPVSSSSPPAPPSTPSPPVPAAVLPRQSASSSPPDVSQLAHPPLDTELQEAINAPMPPRTPEPVLLDDEPRPDPWLPAPADGAFIRKPGRAWRPTVPADTPALPPSSPARSAQGQTAWGSYTTPGEEMLLRADLPADARARLDYSTPVEGRLKHLLAQADPPAATALRASASASRSTSASPTEPPEAQAQAQAPTLKDQLSSAGDQLRSFFQTLPAPAFVKSEPQLEQQEPQETDPKAQVRTGARTLGQSQAQAPYQAQPQTEDDSVSADWLALQRARIQNLFNRVAVAAPEQGKEEQEEAPPVDRHADELVASIALGQGPVPPIPPPRALQPESLDDTLPASVLADRVRRESASPPAAAAVRPKVAVAGTDIAPLLRKQTEWQPPRLPVVFIHGLFGFSELKWSNLSISYWRGASEALQANGCEVLVCHLPTAASIQERAAALKAEVEERFAGREVNFIAHSMGGLDCRYLISRLSHGRSRYSFKVASLTTITTPHRGSSFADYMLEKVVGIARIPRLVSVLTALGVPGGGRAFEDLTTERMAIFNLTCPDRPDVRYFSWGAEFTPTLLSELRFSHGIIFSAEGPNDGLVSVQSSKWGQYQGTLTDVSHLGIIGWNNSAARPAASTSSTWLPAWSPPAWSPPAWGPFKRSTSGAKTPEAPPTLKQDCKPEPKLEPKPDPAYEPFDAPSFFLQICEDLAKEGL